MERIVYRITLDAHKNGIQRTLQGFETGNNMSRQIAITLTASGDTYDLPLDHVVAMMYVMTPNATEPSINSCEIDGNTILYEVLPTDIAEEGMVEMQLKLVNTRVDGTRSVLVSPRLALEVTESNASDEGAEKTTTFTALEDAVARANAVYNSRITRVEVSEDCTFRVHYADGTVYENSYFKDALYNGNALLSESFAHGNTGIREGEDADNSYYYSQVSKSASVEASMITEESRELLEEARQKTAFTVFDVNFDNGNLVYASANYDFDVNEETGNLDVEGGENYNPEKVVEDVVDEYWADTQREIAVERARIDSITTLADGSTTGDAELIDGRIDYKGNTHTNIGEHIRSVTNQISDEIEEMQERDLSQFFELVDKNYYYDSEYGIERYVQMLGGIRDIELVGFDYTLPTRIRMICRNHSSWKYRFIISQFVDGAWKDSFDTYNIDVTENVGGLTEVVNSKSKTSVRMLIDYSVIPDGANRVDGMLNVNGRYNLKKTCFREYNEILRSNNSTKYTWENGELNVYQNGARWRFNTDNNNNTMVCTGYGTVDDFREFSTDILSPFSVKAQQDADGDRANTWGYTGGNHSYNDTSGTPTAKTTLVELFVNNKPVSATSGTFRTLTLHCKHEVQAWNTCKEDGTGRAVLIEDDVYIFDGEKMNVEVKITPLEKIFIGTYYAMQLALPSPYTAYGDKVVSMTGEHDDCVPEYIEGGSDKFTIRMHLDRVGIGNYNYNTSSFKYKTSSQKAYYHPMENSGEFTTSDILWFKGFYKIDKTRG